MTTQDNVTVCPCHGLPKMHSGKQWRCRVKWAAWVRRYNKTPNGRAARRRVDQRRVYVGRRTIVMPTDELTRLGKALIRRRLREFKSRLAH